MKSILNKERGTITTCPKARQARVKPQGYKAIEAGTSDNFPPAPQTSQCLTPVSGATRDAFTVVGSPSLWDAVEGFLSGVVPGFSSYLPCDCP